MADSSRLPGGFCNGRGHLQGTVPRAEMGRRLEDLPGTSWVVSSQQKRLRSGWVTWFEMLINPPEAGTHRGSRESAKGATFWGGK